MEREISSGLGIRRRGGAGVAVRFQGRSEPGCFPGHHLGMGGIPVIHPARNTRTQDPGEDRGDADERPDLRRAG